MTGYDDAPDCPACDAPGDLAVDGGKGPHTPDYHCHACGHRFDT